MSLINHIRSLQKRHNNLQVLINRAFLHFHDDNQVRNLKKQKLALKDKILSLYTNSTMN
ncbi:YdcH family protein [Candidatus Tisiphia endosymbiont of Nemotelus uliginosus]|uniref:YdcH family protein n=1 Tax=Candidatus Tisiphia endosymbiont of Nemotelus uliginosus TaxID=3077926 RepID=UPI0035C92EF1